MAARRRERRSAAGPHHSGEPSHDPPTSTPHRRRLSPSSVILCFSLLLLSFIAALAVYLTGYLTLKPAAPAAPIISVYDRGLVKPDLKFHEILAENARVSANRSRLYFPNPVLAYITPWNSRGYEMAKLFDYKLTHLSPVWYELKSERKKLLLEGRHNVDMEWISEVRKKRHSLVLPRIVLEAFPSELLLKKKQQSKAIDAIVTECKEMGYDGVVLESWSRWTAYGVLHDPDMRSMVGSSIESNSG